MRTIAHPAAHADDSRIATLRCLLARTGHVMARLPAGGFVVARLIDEPESDDDQAELAPLLEGTRFASIDDVDKFVSEVAR